ncbi:cytoplasmic protein [Desulfopila inferna]|uniref:cytoplasmic protein n=1 Tax=Desulfopila inferna TaxID=468528 RepID=UPI0019658133|nr:cytoplasmic protein [Desulfopila inferna]MBM9604338.1 cytoplasmic protein [Desulfopila inferna]
MHTAKKVIFAFRNDSMCFIHVLLNGIDLHERGLGGKIVIEGDAVSLVPEMAEPDHFLYTQFEKARGLGIVYGACRACSMKLRVAEEIEKVGIALVGDMSGHPSMGGFIEQGYEVITF